MVSRLAWNQELCRFDSGRPDRGVAQPGRALGSGPRGRRSKSSHLDGRRRLTTASGMISWLSNGEVAQLVGQQIEHLSTNLLRPSARTGQMDEAHKHPGSNPGLPTMGR